MKSCPFGKVWIHCMTHTHTQASNNESNCNRCNLNFSFRLLRGSAYSNKIHSANDPTTLQSSEPWLKLLQFVFLFNFFTKMANAIFS